MIAAAVVFAAFAIAVVGVAAVAVFEDNCETGKASCFLRTYQASMNFE